MAHSFNPRLPCGRRPKDLYKVLFLDIVSIHASHAGGDGTQPKHRSISVCFNPRLPCGRRLNGDKHPSAPAGVSIHASHAGGDHGYSFVSLRSVMFQSTPPMREATLATVRPYILFRVSIHASHAGGDDNGSIRGHPIPCFNPRLPCGRRLNCFRRGRSSIPFQSTPPMREATPLLI